MRIEKQETTTQLIPRHLYTIKCNHTVQFIILVLWLYFHFIGSLLLILHHLLYWYKAMPRHSKCPIEDILK